MIEVKNLKKKYDNQQALKGVNFTIREGEFYGLLGPNGAGKTTTVSIISTILEPDEGSVILNGVNVNDNPQACKRTIGVVPQEIALYDNLTAYQNLSFWGSLYAIDSSTLHKRIDENLELMGLRDRKDEKIKTFSGGMKRRINIASALLHAPRILFMDEPTVGIDPQSRNLIYEVLEKLHSEKITIVYTTHYMEEAERFCDRIGIIDNGEIIAEGTVNELRQQSKLHEAIHVTFGTITEQQRNQLATLYTDNIYFTENKLTLSTEKPNADLPRLIIKCNELGLETVHIEIAKINLENIFLKLTGKKLRD